MSNLTPKQEKFVQALISGMSQYEAYKEAYNATRMKDATIYNNAYKLMQNNEILTRYNELLEEHKNKALYTREEMVKKGLRQGNGTIYLNAVKELNLLNDLYPDKKAKEESKNEKDIAKVLKEALDDI